MDTFNSNTQFQKIKFSLKIKQRNKYSGMCIGIISNISHRNTAFWMYEYIHQYTCFKKKKKKIIDVQKIY